MHTFLHEYYKANSNKKDRRAANFSVKRDQIENKVYLKEMFSIPIDFVHQLFVILKTTAM
jgi:hypothetical protein